MDGTLPATSNGDRLSAILKKLFEPHVSGDITEELVKAAANGDAVRFCFVLLFKIYLTNINYVLLFRQNVKNIYRVLVAVVMLKIHQILDHWQM